MKTCVSSALTRMMLQPCIRSIERESHNFVRHGYMMLQHTDFVHGNVSARLQRRKDQKRKAKIKAMTIWYVYTI